MATVGFIHPILCAFQTVFRTTLNVEKNEIDSNIPNIANESIVIEDFENWSEVCPMIQIWPIPTEHQIQAQDTGANNINPLWNVITACTVEASDDETLMKNLDTYLTAMLHSAVKSTDDDFWNLDGEADFLIPQSMFFSDVFSVKETSKLAIKGGINWVIDREYTIS